MPFRKKGVTFLICFRKRGLPRKEEGFPQKRGSSNPGGNYAILFGSNSLKVSVLSDINSEDSDVNKKILVDRT